MKIAVLDGYCLNPGDLSWNALKEFGEVEIFDRTPVDQIAAREMGDPEAFWRICDSNAAMRPDALTETIGRRLRITLPEGIPGTPIFQFASRCAKFNNLTTQWPPLRPPQVQPKQLLSAAHQQANIP